MFDLAEVSATLEPGTRIGGYRIVALLGEGAIGRVYLAEHTKLKRRVAVKVLRDELAMSAKAVARFFGEARAVNEIQHRNIVEITDFVEGDPIRGLRSHYVMELLEGRTLKDAIAVLELGIDDILSIALQITGALAAVHEKGIVHRDLKPSDIFLVSNEHRSDFVKLLDFGAAKLSSSMKAGEPDTGSGLIVGTPGYMGPEQIMGEPVDGRADLYALGVVLFEMTTGHLPFQENDLMEMLLKHCTQDPPSPIAGPGRERIPQALASLISACLQKMPEDRPASAYEVYERLQLIRDQRSRRKRVLPASCLALGAASVVALLVFDGKPTVNAEMVMHHLAPPEPEQVLMEFDSVPAGAEVMLGAVLIGRTPLATFFDRSQDAAQVTFHLSEHVSVEQQVPLNTDAHVKVVLQPNAVPPSRATRPALKKRTRKISPAELLSPFE
jgi:serine/threonine-protein kinase